MTDSTEETFVPNEPVFELEEGQCVVIFDEDGGIAGLALPVADEGDEATPGAMVATGIALAAKNDPEGFATSFIEVSLRATMQDQETESEDVPKNLH